MTYTKEVEAALFWADSAAKKPENYDDELGRALINLAAALRESQALNSRAAGDIRMAIKWLKQGGLRESLVQEVIPTLEETLAALTEKEAAKEKP
mgnify:CR=1 FL=1